MHSVQVIVVALFTVNLEWVRCEGGEKGSPSNGECNEDGERVIGFLRYKCSDGFYVKPIGCITEDGEKVDIGKTVTGKWFVFKCDMISETVAQMTPIGCMLYDNEMTPGDQLSYDGFFYECVKTKSGLALQVTGCQDESGEKVDIDRTFERGDFIYACQERGNKVFEKGLACKLDGYELPVHKKFRNSDFLYHCKRVGEYGIELETIGCVGEDNQIFGVDQEFSKSGFRYRCEKRDSDYGPSLAQSLLGCVERTPDGRQLTRNFNETWEKPLENPKYKYIMKCYGSSEEAEQKPTKCGVEKDGKTIEADVGCGVAYSETAVFLCKEEEAGFIEMRLLKYAKRVDLASIASKYGVNAC